MPRLAKLPDLSPARLDLDVYRGDTLTIRVQLRTHGRAINITEGWDFEAHVKSIVDGAIIAEWDWEYAAPIKGVLRLQLSADATQILPPESHWDLQSWDRADRVRTVLRGTIRATPDITRIDNLRRRGGSR